MDALALIFLAEVVSTTETAIWPLVLYGVVVVIVVSGMLGLSHVLGQRHRQRVTGEPYESGMPVTGSARVRFDVKFYVVALLFVVFDVEAVFLFAWAVSVRELGWAGYIEVVVFAGVLLASLAYLWKSGALDWAPRGRQPRTAGDHFDMLRAKEETR